jgi:hypothetical protein
VSYKILTIIIGGLSAAFPAVFSLVIKNYVIDFSGRNLFGFGFSAILYFLLPVYFFLLGLILSAILIHINSLPISLALSIPVSLAASWRTINDAIEIYKRPDYFDQTFFYSDIFDICVNFIIFPLVSVLIWKIKLKFLNNS